MSAEATLTVPMEPITAELRIFVGGNQVYFHDNGHGWMGDTPYPEVDLAHFEEEDRTWTVSLTELNVPDGTPIYWFYTNGYTDSGGLPSKPTGSKATDILTNNGEPITSTVVNGSAHLTVTPNINGLHTRIGPNYIMSSV